MYDLTVEGEPEFYANGALVHNSVWNAWGLKIARAGVLGGSGGIRVVKGTPATSRVIG